MKIVSSLFNVITKGKGVGLNGFEFKNWFKVSLIYYFCIEIRKKMREKIWINKKYESQYKINE
jgi:hypothetical protein